MNELTVIKTVNSRRRKLKIRRLKYTCQTKTQISIVSGHNEKLPEKKQRDAINGDVAYHEVNTRDCPSTPAEISLASKNEVVLEKAEVEKNGDYTCISYGSVSVIGGRREMEDAVSVELGFANKGGEKYDFFGVYDGHGGARVAEACKERLHRLLVEMMMMEGMEWERVMEECFKRMDEEVLKERMMGSTAVVAVVGKEEVVVANCGDSRAVISRAGVAVPLSVDHKPDRPDELERVEAAGGRVINWNGHRVLGVLATSRSIGDQYLKPFVISKPEVTVSKRSEKDEFLILASDGLWDIISNEFACQIVRRCLSGKMRRKSQEVLSESRAAEAAIVLAQLAMARGSRDNISVIVVDLKTPRT